MLCPAVFGGDGQFAHRALGKHHTSQPGGPEGQRELGGVGRLPLHHLPVHMPCSQTPHATSTVMCTHTQTRMYIYTYICHAGRGGKRLGSCMGPCAAGCAALPDPHRLPIRRRVGDGQERPRTHSIRTGHARNARAVTSKLISIADSLMGH